MKNIAILAGNEKQYLEHKDIFLALDGEKMFYINHPDKARGIRFNEFRIVGTFWQDAETPTDILEMVKVNTIN